MAPTSHKANTEKVGRGGLVAAEGGDPSLVKATKLVRTPDVAPGWVIGLFPDAAEASGTFQYRWRRRRELVIGPALDPDRAASEAARRASAKVRRYGVANRLDRLSTLTYAGDGQFDERAFRQDMHGFVRRLRQGLGGDALPYLWVPEWHPQGHGLHAHTLFGKFVPHSLLRSAWSHGIVDIRRLGRGYPLGTIAAARRGAGYVAKYVAKSFELPRIKGLHRYEVAQGFQPRVERIVAATRDEALALASERMGYWPARVWTSEGVEGWQGPPAVWAGWND